MSNQSEEQSQNDSQKPSEERTELAEERSDQAEDRTDWAEHRTVLASERTLSSWLRTSLSAITFGVGIVEFMRGDDPDITIPIAGSILIVLGSGISIVSLWRYFYVNELIEERKAHVTVTPTWVAALLTSGVLIVAILLLLQVIRQM
jgi:putative membrane protein